MTFLGQNRSLKMLLLVATSLSLSSCAFSNESGGGNGFIWEFGGGGTSSSSRSSSSASTTSSKTSSSYSSSPYEWTKEAFDSDVYFQSDMLIILSDPPIQLLRQTHTRWVSFQIANRLLNGSVLDQRKQLYRTVSQTSQKKRCLSSIVGRTKGL